MSKGAIVLSAVPSVVGGTLGQMIEHDKDKNIIIYGGTGVPGVIPALSNYALSNHTHGIPTVYGGLSLTSNYSAWSISVGNYLTTAAQSDHTHSDLYIPLANSTQYATSYLSQTFLTTAANSTHTHDYAGTGVSATGANVTLNSNGIAIEVTGGGAADGYNRISAGTQIAGSVATVSFANSNSVSFGMSAGSVITASISQSTHPHPYLSSVSSTLFATSVLSTALMPIDYSSNFQSAGVYAGTNTSATNVGISVNSNGISVSIDTAGMTALGDGVNILAAGSQTAGTVQTVVFANSNDFTFGMSDSSQITASFSQSTHAHPFVETVNSSLFQHTSATSLITSNAFHTSGSSLLQHTSATSAITSLAMNTSEQNNYFYTSNNTFANETHTHGNISTASTAGTDIAFTSASSGLTVGVPQYITTYAAQSDQPRVISLNGTTGQLSLSGASNITVSALNGSTITIYGPSNILNSFSIGGNTGTTNSSAITGGGYVIAGGSNITLSQSDNSISIHGASGGIRLGGSDTTYTSGTVMISGEANLTVGTTEVGGIQYIKLSAAGATNTAGADGYNWIAAGSQSANTTGYVSFADSNGITFGMSDNSVVTASHNGFVSSSQLTNTFITTQANQALSASNGSFTFETATFGNLNNISFYTTNGSIVASADFATSQYEQAVSGSNGSFSFQTLTFGNLNGLSFYTSNSSLVGSYTVPTTFSQSVQPIYYSASGTLTSASTLQFGNTNGVSFSLSNGSVVGTVVTNYMSSNKSSDFAGLGFTSTTKTGTNITATLSTNGLSMAVPNYLTTAMQSVCSSVFAMTGFTSSSTTGSLLDAILNTDGLLVAIPRYITTAMVSNAGSRFIGTATAETNVTWTANSNGISLNAGAYARTGFTTTTITGSVITGVHNTGGLYLSIPNYITSALTGIYAGTGFTTGSTAGDKIAATLNTGGMSMRVPNYLTTAIQGSIVYTTANGITLGSSVSGNTTTVTGSIDSGNVYFVDSLGSNITWGSSTGTNNNTSIYATAGGGAFQLSGNTLGTTTASGSTVLLYGGNNITLSGYDGSRIRVDGPTGSISFANTNGVSFITTSDTAGVTTISASHNAYSTSSQLTATFLQLASSTRFVGVNTSTVSRTGSQLAFALNSSGATLSIPNWITTAAAAGIGAIGNTASSNAFTTGSVMFSGSNLTVNTSVTGASQYIQLVAPTMGYIFFSDVSGHSWGSSTDGVSTSVYLITA